MTTDQTQAGTSTSRIAVGVAIGVLAALLIAWMVYAASQPSDLDCSIQLLEEGTGQRASWDVDDACRP